MEGRESRPAAPAMDGRGRPSLYGFDFYFFFSERM